MELSCILEVRVCDKDLKFSRARLMMGAAQELWRSDTSVRVHIGEGVSKADGVRLLNKIIAFYSERSQGVLQVLN